MGTAFLSLKKALLTACTLLLSLAFLLATTWGGLSLCGTCLYPPLFLQFFSLRGRVSWYPLSSSVASARWGAVIREVLKFSSVVQWVPLCKGHALAVYMQDDISAVRRNKKKMQGACQIGFLNRCWMVYNTECCFDVLIITGKSWCNFKSKYSCR